MVTTKPDAMTPAIRKSPISPPCDSRVIVLSQTVVNMSFCQLGVTNRSVQAKARKHRNIGISRLHNSPPADLTRRKGVNDL